MFYFYTNVLAFTPEFIGRVNLVDGVAQLAGIALYNARLKHVPLTTVFTWVVLLGAAASSTQLLLVTRANAALGIPDAAFALVDSALLTALGRLRAGGNSLFVVEHDLDVIAEADWVIDMGPEAGANGGRIVAEGPPATIMKKARSHTGKALRDFLTAR
jgi:hypothetical protein